MNISPYEFEKAKEGSLFVKKGNKLVSVSFDELTKELKSEISKNAELGTEIKDMGKYITHFKTLAKSHFILVFNLFLTKVMLGVIQVEDENLLKLDEKVIKGELSVEQALEEHEYLKETFTKLFLETDDKIEFPMI